MTKRNRMFMLRRNGVPGMIRTCDLRFRKPLLYPAELRGRARQFKHFLIIASSFCWAGLAHAASIPACFPQGGFEARDARAKNAQEIDISSKETILLAGIHIPLSLETRTVARISELVSGKTLRYVQITPAKDRYARLPAEVAAGELWLQGTLVEEGLGVAMPSGLKTPCAAELLQIEQAARRRKAGLWSQPNEVEIKVIYKTALEQAVGRFAIVEGRVAGVGVRDYASFINFGFNYRQDFAAIIVKKHIAAFEAKHALATLKGKKLRIRGIVESSPPRLHLEEPLALEVVE